MSPENVREANKAKYEKYVADHPDVDFDTGHTNISTIVTGPVGFYSQLSYDKIQDVLTSQDAFSTISIFFQQLTLGINGEPYIEKQLDLDTGFAGTVEYYNSVSNYRSNYQKWIESPFPGEDSSSSAEVSSTLVDEVFDYICLPANRAYFFSGDEFTGLTQPYESPKTFINEDNYVFVIQIYYPNDHHRDCWVISKCINEPNEIWQGLIDILEENFISQFE
jgi:hypothetical protein